MTEPGLARRAADREADSPEDVLYEQYLDAALSGALESPEAFCARNGVASAGLRERLAALRRLIDAERRPSGPPPTPLAAEPGLPWPRLGEFRLLKRLSEGGMGVLYLAEQESLGRLVALKVIRPELAGSAAAAERFRREAKALAKLRHPHIVAVHAFGQEQDAHGVLWCAMELVPGRSLAEILAEARDHGSPPKVADVLRWLEPIARALDAAHEQGILHRDVKPSNLRITPEGRALLVDFGLVRDLGSEAPTLTHEFAGSPAYASPEQVKNRHGELDGRTDIYSLGVTLYEGLTLEAPFAGDSLERVFHRILSEDPPPLRKLRPDVPRDLEIVALRALEKEPARRYARAGDFADDLLAVLELRPIKARAPGPLALAQRWVRRHRTAAAALAVLLIALASFAVFLVVNERRQRRADQAEAKRLVTEAERLLDRYVADRTAVGNLADEIAEVERTVQGNYVPLERVKVLDRKGEIDRLERERLLVARQVEERLRNAERLDPEVEGAERLRGDLFVEEWREARAVFDFPRMTVLEELVRGSDAEQRHVAEISGDATLTITTDPPGAEVHLFQLRSHADVVPGGQARDVPVPCGGLPAGLAPGSPPGLGPGSIVLRVTAPLGELRENDLVVELAGRPIAGTVFVTSDAGELLPFDRLARVDGNPVGEVYDVERAFAVASAAPAVHRFEFETLDGRTVELQARDLAGLGVELGDAAMAAELGGAAARVWQDGTLREVELPAGLRVRATARPLLVSAESRVGTTPWSQSHRRWETWLALLRLEGHEDARVVIFPPQGWNMTAHVDLLKRGSSPPEMVRVLPGFGGVAPFWIMDREVTCADYLEFLNDPETRRRIGRARPIPLVPRSSADSGATGDWPRDPDGSFRLGGGFAPRWPVIGITCNDAREFIDWKNKTSDIEAYGLRYALPTLAEWRHAAHGNSSNYVWGDSFRPHWCSACYARPAPNPEPILRFPIDESLSGVFDLSGSASEWCDTPFDDPAKGQQAIAGGNWAIGGPSDFKAEYSFGLPPHLTSGIVGMRLLARPIESKR